MALLTGFCVNCFKFKHLLQVQFNLKLVSISQNALNCTCDLTSSSSLLSIHLYGYTTTVSEPCFYGNYKICLDRKRILELYANVSITETSVWFRSWFSTPQEKCSLYCPLFSLTSISSIPSQAMSHIWKATYRTTSTACCCKFINSLLLMRKTCAVLSILTLTQERSERAVKTIF